MTHLERLAKKYELNANGIAFFDYIIESQANGDFEQVRNLAKELKRNELVMFCEYALMEYGGAEANEVIKTLSR